MVTTRSQLVAEDTSKTTKAKRSSNNLLFIVKAAPKAARIAAAGGASSSKKSDVEPPPAASDNDEDMDDSEDNSEMSDDDSEEMDMPDWVKESEDLSRVFESTKSSIYKRRPDLLRILTTPMRKRHRRILFEWHHIYKNLMPGSQDRMDAREMIHKLFQEYKRGFVRYSENKEQIRAMEKSTMKDSTMSDMEYKILALETSDENKKTIYRKFMELREKEADERDDEFFKIKQWLTWATRMPFDRTRPFSIIATDPGALTEFIRGLRRRLDDILYGMNDVKDQIMLFVHHKLVHPDMKGSSLGLIGDPGVGKTTIARCMAGVMGFPFEQIAFGGVKTVEHLKGFDFTFVGSQPGEVAKCMSRMGCKNGILFLDEYEKVADSPEMNAFLLHLTDFSQNSDYRDNYLSDVAMDLSCLWLIYSMNNQPDDKALRDRIFTIRIPGYKTQDKVCIVRDFLLPKFISQQKNIDKDAIRFADDSAIMHLLDRIHTSKDKGMRRVEQAVKDLVFKITFLVHHGDSFDVRFSYKGIKSYPVVIDRPMIDALLIKNDEDDNGVSRMFI